MKEKNTLGLGGNLNITDEEISLYFEKHLTYFSIDDIKALIVTLEIERIIMSQRPKIKYKERFVSKYTRCLNLIESDLSPDPEIAKAIKALKDFVATKSMTRLDVKKEVLEDLKELRDDKNFDNLIKDVREHLLLNDVL